jgi:hypothetical protein
MQGTAAFLERAKAENKLALITYPERFKSWDSAFDGIEVFSLHTAAKQMNPLIALGDLIWTYPSYPELMLAKGWTRPDANLGKFDEIAAQRKISLFAGTDAHSNIGFHLFGDDAGNKPLGIKLDPYKTMFRIARLHVLIENDKEFDRETLIEAIRAGRFFVGFDVLGDTAGFRFTISSPTDSWSGGDVVENRDGLLLNANYPADTISRFVIYRNGQSIHDSKEEYSHSTEIPVPGPGVYRVEGYRDWLGQPFDKMPWIISNPIYVR